MAREWYGRIAAYVREVYLREVEDIGINPI